MTASRVIIIVTVLGLTTCVIARVFNFGWNTVFYSIVVLPSLALHVTFQLVRVRMNRGRLKVAVFFSLVSNMSLVASSIIIPDGDDTGLIVAVFGTIINPPDTFYDIGIAFFGAGMFFSLLTIMSGIGASHNNGMQSDAAEPRR